MFYCFFYLQKANAQIADPSVTNIQTIQNLGCFDSMNNVQIDIVNNGATIDFSINPLTVNLSVRHANGTIIYSDTISAGLLPTNATQIQIFPNVNLYEGGCYFLNTTLSLVGGGNTNTANDSLSMAYKVCNTRPSAIDYFMGVGDTIPNGQGLSIAGCPDSIMIPVTNFCFTGNIPDSPTSCSPLGAGCFASVSLPTLPPGVSITGGEIVVTNLYQNGFPSMIQSTRFCLYQGSLPITIPNLFHNGLVGISPSFGPATYHSYPPVADMNLMYSGSVPVTPTVNLGHWSTTRCTTPNFLVDFINNPPVVYLKIKYAYTTPGTKWYEQNSGGISISQASVLDPLTTPNSIVNNSNTSGIYTFYGACLSDTNCRVAVDLNISITQNLLTPEKTFDNFTVYPNPANKEIMIKSDNLLNYKLSMVNLQGQTILKRDFQDKIVRIDLNDIAPGVYMLYLSSAVGKKEFKILIDR